MQYGIKKGNKAKIENVFRSLLFYITKTPSINNNFKFKDILKAFVETKPKISVKTKRKGSKNIYLPVTISKKRSKFYHRIEFYLMLEKRLIRNFIKILQKN